MKQSLVAATAQALYDQIMIVKEANKTEFEQEANRMTSMVHGASGVAELAEKEIRFISETNLIPQDSVLIASGAQRILEKPKQKGLLMDEFNRP